jgi:predicted hydrolase (HD superfamily)
MISRENALKLLNQHVKSLNMIRHSLASEAVLRAIALKLGKDQDEWGISGLLHDVDVEITNADPLRHGPHSVGLLEGLLSSEAIDAIVMHNEMATDKERSTVFQHALAAGETITGLIMATAKELLLPIYVIN